ncbi:MAG: dephospho-CoA kinase [Saprospiraceae bacterium]|nr:dephospho-CoA kinase [Saprospiraceae bacterium]
MKKIGITGGIGSGKTTVCRIFETLGIPIYYADERAKWLMNHDKKLVAAIKELFGSDAYTVEGELNRKYLAQLAFNDRSLLQHLNAIVHPAVFEDGERWFQQQSHAPYALKEAALIYESGGYTQLDGVIVVTAPEPLRIQRVVARDNSTEEEVAARINQQMPEAEKVARADYLIYNDGEHPLIPQVMAIHQRLSASL